MRLLFLTPGFPAHENDHNCIPPLQLLARELVRQGVDLKVIALEYPFHDQPYRWHGIPVWPCGGHNRLWLKVRTLLRAFQHSHDLLDTAQTGLAMGEEKRGEPLRILHSFWFGWTSIVGERLARSYGLPHFTTLMGQDVLPANFFLRQSLQSADPSGLVSVSVFQNAVLEKTTGCRAAHVIPWGVDEREIPADFSQNRPLDVLGVGSLLPVKNWEAWLRIVQQVAKNRPALRAELVGDGPERGRLEKLARFLDLGKNVRFAGHLPRPAVLEKMKQAKTLLHTAHFESFGFVLAEAAMCGCRTVSAPVGIAPAFDFTGENEAVLTEKLLAALDLPVRREPFTPFLMTKTAQSYLALYRSAGRVQ